MFGQYTPRHGVYTIMDPRHDPGQPHHRIISARSEESVSGETITGGELGTANWGQAQSELGTGTK
jgi:hypothetical protein